MTILSLCLDARSQVAPVADAQAYTYHPPSTDKTSWQRLNLQLSSTFLVVAKEGQVEHDTCLYIASRSLGLSRFAVLREGMDDPDLNKEASWIDRNDPAAAIRRLATTGRKRLRLLVLLGAYYAFEPHSYYRYQDSVTYFLTKALQESKLLNEGATGRIALCLLGKSYVQAGDPKGDSIYNVLIGQSRKAGDTEMEARAFAWRGMYTVPTQATFQRKITDLQAASAMYRKAGRTEPAINVTTDLGYLLQASGQFDAANETFLEALTLARSIHFPYVHYNTNALATVSLFSGKFGESFSYSVHTTKTAENCRDSVGWAYFYAGLSQLYNMEGRQAESDSMDQKAIHYFIVNHDPAVFSVLESTTTKMSLNGQATQALALIAGVSGKVGRPVTLTDQFFKYNALASCYIYLGRFDSATACIAKMDSLETQAEAIRGPMRRFMVSSARAHLLLKQGHYRQSQQIFEEMIHPSAGFNGGLISELYAYEWLLHVDSVLADYPNMALHYKQYTHLLDSNFQITKLRQAEELQVLYETKDKENQITLLNKQASQASLIQRLTLAGIAAVLVIAGLLYWQNRQKQKNNRLITEKNFQLQHLLTDREWLLKEIHHRVKNNLQIVSSLLNSQAVYINNKAALAAIDDSKRRVYAMSLIHQKLYQSKNIATIAMPAYVAELVNHIQDSFLSRNRIVVEREIEPLELDVSQAIPLGLIINECVVNSLKYAFPEDRGGRIMISLTHEESDHLLLCIADNGIGLPADFDMMEQNSLGLELVRGLAKQLKGRLNMESNGGLQITVRFAITRRQIQEESFVNH